MNTNISPPDTFSALIEDGQNNYRRGNHSRALEAFNEALLHIQDGDELERAKTLNNIGVTQLALGEHKAGLETLELAHSAYLNAGDLDSAAKVMANQGAAMAQLKLKSQAAELLEKAAENLEGEERADTLMMLGRLELQKGRFMKAIFTYHKALASRTNKSFPDRVLEKLINLALRGI
ncbi:MAG: hypothetical protein ABFQ89_04610 [Chloroflexota bacterium]